MWNHSFYATLVDRPNQEHPDEVCLGSALCDAEPAATGKEMRKVGHAFELRIIEDVHSSGPGGRIWDAGRSLLIMHTVVVASDLSLCTVWHQPPSSLNFWHVLSMADGRP